MALYQDAIDNFNDFGSTHTYIDDVEIGGFQELKSRLNVSGDVNFPMLYIVPRGVSDTSNNTTAQSFRVFVFTIPADGDNYNNADMDSTLQAVQDLYSYMDLTKQYHSVTATPALPVNDDAQFTGRYAGWFTDITLTSKARRDTSVIPR